MGDELAIKVEGVSKNFKLPHEKHNSLKSKMVHMFNRTKGYQTQHALKDVSFEIKKGEFFGIVGRNGSGKSTLLKLLAGIYQPTEGKISVQGKLVPFIELGVGFNPELTGRENVFLNGALLGFDNNEIANMYDEIVEFAELERFMDQKLKNYSSGMQVRLAFSMAVRARADILLIDEVLAVGDVDFQRKCFEHFKHLKKNKKTVVFVSHDMNAIKEYCDRAMLVNESEIVDIDNSQEIAKKYSLLFIDNQFDDAKDSTDPNIVKRWGTKKVEFTSIRVRQADGHIHVEAKIKANEEVEKVIYGIHITGADGSEITAVNNRYIDARDINKLNTNEEAEIEWNILNIFTDGKYFITLTLVGTSDEVYDWFTDASKLTIRRTERSTTSIIPPMSATVKYINAKDGKGR